MFFNLKKKKANLVKHFLLYVTEDLCLCLSVRSESAGFHGDRILLLQYVLLSSENGKVSAADSI